MKIYVTPTFICSLLFTSISYAGAPDQTFFVMHPDNANMTEFDTEGMSLVQRYYPPRNRRRKPNIVMVAGHSLDSRLYTQTPDGRESFAELVAAQGYNVYVMDTPFYELSGIDPSRTNTNQANLSSVWKKWGFGNTYPTRWPDSQYPSETEALRNAIQASFPEYFGAGGNYNSIATANNLEVLIDDLGSATLMFHSAAGVATFELIDRETVTFDALIAYEPLQCPGNNANYPNMETVPFIAIYGDYISQRRQTGRYDACLATVNKVLSVGGNAEFVDLPEMGITGNSHLYVQAYNNSQIADIMVNALEYYGID